MPEMEYRYEREGPEYLVRAFFYVLRHLLEKRGFHANLEHTGPEGPDAYGFANNGDRLVVEMISSGPGTTVIGVEANFPLENLLRETLDVYIEGIKVLLEIKDQET